MYVCVCGTEGVTHKFVNRDFRFQVGSFVIRKMMCVQCVCNVCAMCVQCVCNCVSQRCVATRVSQMLNVKIDVCSVHFLSQYQCW